MHEMIAQHRHKLRREKYTLLKTKDDSHLITYINSTVVSEKKETFICELILERYIYLRNTQKQLKITNYARNKSFLKFYLVYNDVCLKLLESLLYKLGDFAPLCIKIGG